MLSDLGWTFFFFFMLFMVYRAPHKKRCAKQTRLVAVSATSTPDVALNSTIAIIDYKKNESRTPNVLHTCAGDRHGRHQSAHDIKVWKLELFFLGLF